MPTEQKSPVRQAILWIITLVLVIVAIVWFRK
jgi:hypothetical protein